jgi:general secretion pathway protein L
MLREYFDWWARQMLDLVPDRLRQWAAEDEDALLIEPEANNGEGEPGGIVLALRRGRRIGGLGRFAFDAAGLDAAANAAGAAGRPGSVQLRLSPGLLLEKSLTLPMAAERDVERVLAYEMDRETPFAPDEVWWDFAVEQRDRARGKLSVRLSLVPKAAVAALVASLERHGIRPNEFTFALPSGSVRTVALDVVEAHRPWRARTVPLAAAACAALALLAVVIPFMRQSIALASVDRRIAALQPAVDEAQLLRQRLEGSGGADVVDAERARLGDPLAVLGAATAILPDNTYLTDFTMRERKLNFNGQSAAAANLIGALAGDPTFRNPAFAAPVTRIEGTTTDGFSISAEARP